MVMERTSDTLGGVDDRAEVSLDGQTLIYAESYEVRHHFFTQSPNVFALRLGYAGPPSQLIKLAAPRRRMELFVAGIIQDTGWTDGPEASSDGSGGTVITVHGRDKMAELHDASVLADKTFKNLSYGELAFAVLAEAVGEFELVVDGGNRANRMASTGSSTRSQPVDTNAADNIKPALVATQGRTLRAKSSEKWWKFLKDQLDRAGLFLITGARGEFILCAPNVTQKPLYRILREAEQTRNLVCDIKVSYKNVATGRHTVYQVHGKGGGGGASSGGVHVPDDVDEDIKPALLKIGASSGSGRKNAGQYVDPEMVAWGYPMTRVWSHKDTKVTGPKQAEYLARFHAAYDRRQSWSLVFTVPGHTTPSLDSGERVTWAIDTLVQVDDYEYDIHGIFWIEAVVFRRDSNGTSTEIHLMRPEDLVFGEPG